MLSGLFRRYETTSSNRVDRRLIVPLGSQRALGHLESALFHRPKRRVTRRISRPTSFPSRLGGPTWTSRRPTRSGQLRPPWRLRWICYACAFPSPAFSLAKQGLAYSSSSQCEVVHRCGKIFWREGRGGKKKWQLPLGTGSEARKC